ncbi:MAG: hypothetical protein BWY85_01552 [Firmicutes bacterium ADurb.Bin506]|jgi:predicted RNA-binding protein YlqC (UPF0109 family)|nr:MAG: hypothetical protein BWY85_01552 [Firmicutes bacterium ADurb.Bin506]
MASNGRRNRVELSSLVSYMASHLVDQPELVNVKQIEADDSVILEIRVAPDDMGKVIGRHGRVARALRTVTKAIAVRQGKRAMVEIVE